MGVETATVTLASGLMLSYAVQGDPSGPAVVLLPGPLDSWVSYEPTLDRMPPSIRAIALSQRGHGDSDKPASGYRVEDLAADVVPAMDALGISRATLVGHSGSCLVARRVAIDDPDRVAGLVLEASPTSLKSDPQLAGYVDSVIATLTDPIDPAFARSVLFDTSSYDLDPDLADRLVDELLKVPARVWRGTLGGVLDHDDLAELPHIDAPALLVWGDADGLVSREMQEALVRSLPNATLVTYPGIGHSPRWEDPDRFAADLVAFVEQLP